MFLSRLRLRPSAHRHPGYWSHLSDLYGAHQEVWRLLGAGPRSRRDFLYRLAQRGGRPVLYALAPRPARDPKGIWSVESRPFEPRLRVGQRLGFLLRANAVRRQGHMRHDIVMAEKHRRRQESQPQEEGLTASVLAQQAGETWLRERGRSHGFELEGAIALGYRVVEFPQRRRKDSIRLGISDFEGVLRVADGSRFWDVLRSGIGPAKAFGCGMLMVRPL